MKIFNEDLKDILTIVSIVAILYLIAEIVY